MENANVHMDMTVGETVEGTIGNNTKLTQGFQQPNLQMIIPVIEPSLDGKIQVFPNPAKSSLSVVIDVEGSFVANIYDLAGYPLLAREFTNATQVDLKNLVPGSYGITITRNNDLVYASMIVKLK
jgi:hypothetical protein